jgi:hypothetical protein
MSMSSPIFTSHLSPRAAVLLRDLANALAHAEACDAPWACVPFAAAPPAPAGYAPAARAYLLTVGVMDLAVVAAHCQHAQT